MTAPTTRRATNAFIGSPIERLEDLRFLTGRGQYTDDLTDEKMLHAVILRSSVAHGRIRSIDTVAARARYGRMRTKKDLPRRSRMARGAKTHPV